MRIFIGGEERAAEREKSEKKKRKRKKEKKEGVRPRRRQAGTSWP